MRRDWSPPALLALAAVALGCPPNGTADPEPALEVSSALPPAAANATGADYPAPTTAPVVPTGLNPAYEAPEGSPPPVPTPVVPEPGLPPPELPPVPPQHPSPQGATL